MRAYVFWIVVAIIVFFMWLVMAHGGASARKSTYIYDKAVNEVLDNVMDLQDEMQHKHLKMNWSQFNSEICRRMNVRRTEPWQRR